MTTLKREKASKITSWTNDDTQIPNYSSSKLQSEKNSLLKNVCVTTMDHYTKAAASIYLMTS